MKERITLTLDSDILKRIDQSVDGFHIKNRSHAVELLLLKGMKTEIPAHAIILAAGNNKKITGLPAGPVGMLPVHNKPIIEHLIELFAKHNVRDILIGICYNKDDIKHYFGNGSRFGVKIRYIEEDKPSGTTTLVKKARPFLTGSFFVTNSDELKDVDLRDMYHCHKQSNALTTLALTTVSDPQAYGVVRMDGIRVREFQEKPDNARRNKLINAGLYLMDLEILDMIPDSIKMFYDFWPILAKQDKLVGYNFSGQWFDISSREKYDRAQKEWRG